MSKTCPHCKQAIMVRYGVTLTKRRVEIFDAIERAGKEGITLERLAAMLYPGDNEEIAKHRVRVHVPRLNDVLVETTVRIESMPGTFRSHGGRYRLHHERAEAAA